MKYRILGVLATVAMLTLCVCATSLSARDTGKVRVHQHLSSRQPDAGCDCDGGELCTHLPLVLIDTGGSAIPGAPMEEEAYGGEMQYTLTDTGETMLPVRISILDDEHRNHHPSDQPDLESSALIRMRGNSSRFFEKKGYLFRFTKADGSYADHTVMGMDAHYEWALHGPYLDKSLLRNYMWYNIAGEIMDYAPNVRFCEVLLNGAYQGVYVMTETITNGEDCRVQISEPIDNTLSTGYVLRLDRGSANDLKNLNNFTRYTYRVDEQSGLVVDIEYPRSGDLTQQLADAIQQDLSDFEKALYSFDYDSPVYGFQTEIDVESFADYFILNEFTQNYDAGWLSTYLYKDIGGKFRMVVWDFNNACDNYRLPQPDRTFLMQNALWQWMLCKDEAYTQRIIDRYRELRTTYLSEAYLLNYIDETVAYLGDAVERNFSVWGHTFQSYRRLSPDARNSDNFDEAVEQLRSFIRERGAWMDENIEILRQYSHPSKNKKFNH